MREVLLDTPVSESFIDFLRTFGTVMTLDTMGPGFFKYDLKDGFSIKGWVGDTNLEIRYQKEVLDICEDFVSVLFFYFHDGEPEISKLQRMEKRLSEKISLRKYGNSDGNPVHG